MLVHAKDSDAVARYLLTETAARDLEITAQGLEEAFLNLTASDHDDQERPRDDRSDAPSTRPPAGCRRSAASTPPLGIEMRRMLRNRRTVIFALVFPAAMSSIFGTSGRRRRDTVGSGNVAAYVLVSMALYGARADRRRDRLDGRRWSAPSAGPDSCG